MKIINVNTWNRKSVYQHFSTFTDPYFGLVIPFNVTRAYQFSKENNISFFARYLHDCMKAINSVENLKYRIEGDNVVAFDVIHASTVIMRDDNTFGFSFMHYDEDLKTFIKNIEKEKDRINNSADLYPPENGLNCIHSSALPWFNFTGERQPISGKPDSVPKLAFAKAEKVNNELIMNVSIHVNHALVDGYHVGLFSQKFQHFLNQ